MFYVINNARLLY